MKVKYCFRDNANDFINSLIMFAIRLLFISLVFWNLRININPKKATVYM